RIEPGLSLRMGHGSQSHRLLALDDLRPWRALVDQGVTARDAGAYVDVDARVREKIRITGGVRADALVYSVAPRPTLASDLTDDEAASAAPAPATATGFVVSPRVACSWEIESWLQPTIAYGEGFRSPAAAQITTTDPLPIAKSRTMEAGVRSVFGGGRT